MCAMHFHVLFIVIHYVNFQINLSLLGCLNYLIFQHSHIGG